jgi:hypothetical protein
MKAVLLVLLVGALVHAAKIGDRPGFNVGLRRNVSLAHRRPRCEAPVCALFMRVVTRDTM